MGANVAVGVGVGDGVGVTIGVGDGDGEGVGDGGGGGITAYMSNLKLPPVSQVPRLDRDRTGRPGTVCWAVG